MIKRVPASRLRRAKPTTAQVSDRLFLSHPGANLSCMHSPQEPSRLRTPVQAECAGTIERRAALAASEPRIKHPVLCLARPPLRRCAAAGTSLHLSGARRSSPRLAPLQLIQSALGRFRLLSDNRVNRYERLSSRGGRPLRELHDNSVPPRFIGYREMDNGRASQFLGPIKPARELLQ